MKKIVILSMLLLLMTVSVFAGTARSYFQKVAALDPAVDILTLVTSTLSTYTAPNYIVTADIVETPGEVLSTATGTPTTSLRLNKTGNGTTVPFYAVVNVQLGTFPTQWLAGTTLRITVTKTDLVPNQMATWDFTIPTGTTVINNNTVAIGIPPEAPVVTSTVVAAENPIPAMGAIDVPFGTVSLGWTYPTGENITPAVSYTVKYGTDPLLVGAATQLVTATSYDITALSSTIYYWQVIPSDQANGTKAGFQLSSATNNKQNFAGPIWHFTTAAEVLPPNTIVIPTAGTFELVTTFGVTATGTVSAPGTLVFGEINPAKVGTFNGYLNVQKVYTVTASDQAVLNGATLNFNYGIVPGYQYVAIHWGGTNNGYYPVNNPETPGVPTPGYYFNGGTGWAPPYNFPLGIAPFTGAGYAAGILTIGPIPNYSAKDAGIFEVILGKDVDLPVELSSFSAVATAQMFVNLQWTTESETENLGFNVLRSSDNVVSNASYVNLGIINGTNTTTTHNYNFVDNTVDPSTTYYYWLEMVDFQGTSHLSNMVTVNTTDGQAPVVPVTATTMSNAYPNPFNQNTVTNLDVTVKNGENATLTIYNVLGQSVKTYSLRSNATNKITWNGKDDRGAACGSGIYFAKLSSPSVNTTKKMVIVK